MVRRKGSVSHRQPEPSANRPAAASAPRGTNVAYQAGVAEEIGGPDVADEAAAVLTALDPEQREVALTVRGPVCVLAGAGTGKTRAITHRIAYAVHTGVTDPAHVLAVTFTSRAAGELRGRLRLLGRPGLGLDRVQARTFHSAALRQLTHFWPAVVGGRPPRVLASKIRLIAEAARAQQFALSGADLADTAAEIEWAKVTQVRPDQYPTAAVPAGRRPPRGAAQTGQIYAGYEDLRRERHLIDFESVLELTAAILADSRAAAAEVRDRYRYLVVDEYQDVNPLQKLLLDQWLGDREDLCVVGDPDQAIYSFTGASPRYLTGFAAEFPAATVIRLVRDYRSTPQVVTVANRLIAAADDAAGVPGAAVARWATALVAQRPPGPEPSFAEYPDDQAEADAVAARVSCLIAEGVPAREIAVLVRINAQTPAFERALHEAGVAYQVRGAERFFDRAEVRQAIALLRAAAKSQPGAADRASAPRAADAAAGATGAVAGAAGAVAGAAGTADAAAGAVGTAGAVAGAAGTAGAEAEAAGMDRAAPLPAEVRHVLAGLGLTDPAPPGGGAARDRWESLAALLGLAEDLSLARPGITLAGFAAELAERVAAEHPPAAPGVTLSSLHAAKGLEWDVVFLPGLAEGVLPIVYAQTTEAIAEERRLLYVGVTRARQRVELSWAAARSPGSKPSRRPSRFLGSVRKGTVAGS
jgi:DNA helicase II / ATP-dependent DNA helicase PcrA